VTNWFIETLRHHPEIAIFLALGIGYWFGGKSFKGISLGAVTSTLIVAVIIGQLDIRVSANVKTIFFLLFLFAVGYGVGPQFVRGIAKDGLPQALFAAVLCVLCLGTAYVAARLAGYDLGYSAGLYAGSQTISASMGLATDAINRLGKSADQTKQLLDAMPIAYAVTYIFGTIGSAVLLAKIGPALLRIDLAAECRRYEQQMGESGPQDQPGGGWHKFELRAYRVRPGGPFVGLTAAQAERLAPHDTRLFIERIRRGGEIIDATSHTVLDAGDIVAVAGRREVLVDLLEKTAEEVEDPELLAIPLEGVDVLVTHKQIDGMTLEQAAQRPEAHGIFLSKITRGATATNIPVLPQTQIHRGDILTLVGRTSDITRAAKVLGYADKASNVADVAFIGGAIAIGTLIGALTLNIGDIPLTLSTAGGALLAGLLFGWLRSVHPTFGRIPSSTVWFMNSVGLNVFIAVVGISAGPGFVEGLQQLGVSLFLWGIATTMVPLVIGIFVGRYIFRFDPAILFGCCAGARTTTAALGMICEAAESNVPGLGYTVTYAVGNTLLTIWGMVIIMLLA
jgi:putative transport protein